MPTRQFEMRSIAAPAQVECETLHPQRKQTLFDSERSFGTMNWALASPLAVSLGSIHRIRLKLSFRPVRLTGVANMNAQQRGKFVAYYRASAHSQGRSGLRLDAQRKAVADYLNGGAWELVGEFTEIESGNQSQRPELIKALAACRKLRARLVIAKFNKLSRSLAFITRLMHSDVDFIALDNPHADRLTIHSLATVAQHGREMISERTKAGLAAAKATGKKLGTRDPKGAVERMAKAREAKAEKFAASVLPVIRAIEALGFTSNAAIAAQLNARNVPTPRGKEWTPVQIGRVRSRSLGLLP